MYEFQALGKAGCIQVNSDAEMISARSFGLRNPICVIPNGVEMPDLTRPIVSKLGDILDSWKRNGHQLLLYLGRLHPKKNLPNLIRAFSIASARRDDWVLLIAGWDQGGHEAELRQLGRSLGLGDRLCFLGPQFGISKELLFRKSDAFVLPSLSEGLPIAVLEAWAYAKPTLITPQCNLSVGYEREAAIRIEPDRGSIAEGLRQLFEMGDAERLKLGDNARQLASQKFSWSGAASQIRTVYAWLVGGGTTPDCVVCE
jgi:poly(glycerol-phosphate) alpha-glucosyltransferase